MGQMKIILPDEVERTFREVAMRRFGYQRGSISEASVEAIKYWSKMNQIKRTPKKTFMELRGLLKHVKKTSVELQHEAWD